MRRVILITVLSLLIGQSSKAQYSLMTRGQLCPFDTAVAIHVDTYRMESRKLNLADSVIANLQARLDVSLEATAALQNRLELDRELLKVREQQIAMKNKQMEALIANYTIKPKDTWWTRNERTIYLVGGMIGGGIIVYMLR